MAVSISTDTTGGRTTITIIATASNEKVVKVRDELVTRTKSPDDSTNDNAYLLEWLRNNVVLNFFVTELDNANIREAEQTLPTDEDFD